MPRLTLTCGCVRGGEPKRSLRSTLCHNIGSRKSHGLSGVYQGFIMGLSCFFMVDHGFIMVFHGFIMGLSWVSIILPIGKSWEITMRRHVRLGVPIDFAGKRTLPFRCSTMLRCLAQLQVFGQKMLREVEKQHLLCHWIRWN